MPQRCAEEDLVGAASEVLGMMFFTSVLEDGESSPAEAAAVDKPVAVRVDFDGHTAGMLQMTMGSETAENLTANFLGLAPDEAPSAAQVADVVNELGNMLCGCFLSRHDAEELFALTPPRMLVMPEPPQPPPTVTRSLQLDIGNLLLALRWDHKSEAA